MGKMYEIEFDTLEDGSIELKQPCGVDDPSVIYLSSDQLHLITAQLCGNGERAHEPSPPAVFWQLLARVRDKSEDLFNLVESVPCFPPRDEETTEITAARELLEEIEFLMAEFAPSNGATGTQEPAQTGMHTLPPENATRAVCEANTAFADKQMPLLGA